MFSLWGIEIMIVWIHGYRIHDVVVGISDTEQQEAIVFTSKVFVNDTVLNLHAIMPCQGIAWYLQCNF